jgi:hypothetical protein
MPRSSPIFDGVARDEKEVYRRPFGRVALRDERASPPGCPDAWLGRRPSVSRFRRQAVACPPYGARSARSTRRSVVVQTRSDSSLPKRRVATVVPSVYRPSTTYMVKEDAGLRPANVKRSMPAWGASRPRIRPAVHPANVLNTRPLAELLAPRQYAAGHPNWRHGGCEGSALTGPSVPREPTHRKDPRHDPDGSDGARAPSPPPAVAGASNGRPT